jgi:selenocysteine lyase/cysteine desulfurase
VGLLWGRREHLEALDLPRLRPAPERPPESLETGTQNHEGIVGVAAAVDFLASMAEGATRRERLAGTFAALHARGNDLVSRMWSGLTRIDGVRVYGPPPGRPRTPTIAFAVRGCPSDRVASALADRGVFVSNGDFYATTAVARLGHVEDGLVRAGCACYTTEEEVERLIAGVTEIARTAQ